MHLLHLNLKKTGVQSMAVFWIACVVSKQEIYGVKLAFELTLGKMHELNLKNWDCSPWPFFGSRDN